MCVRRMGTAAALSYLLALAFPCEGERRRQRATMNCPVTSLALVISVVVLANERERFVQRHSRVPTKLVKQAHKKKVSGEPLFDVGLGVVAVLDHRPERSETCVGRFNQLLRTAVKAR